MSPRRRQPTDATELTPDQRAQLMYPWHIIFGTDPAFPSEDAARSAWQAHRDELMEAARAGGRPFAFWRFETDIGLGPTWEDTPGVDSMTEFRERYPAGWSEEAAWLDVHDLLSDEEQAAVRRRVANVAGPTSEKPGRTPGAHRGNGGPPPDLTD